MNKKNFSSYLYSRLLLIFSCFIIALTLVRCDKWVQPENDTKISSHGDDESVDGDHKFNGQNCMNCHYTEGRGEGWFTLAGTVTGNNDVGIVNVYEDFTQAPIKTIEVDAEGNFYTTETIDFTNGLNVSIVDDNGNQQAMSAKVFNGQCNLCHGVTTSKLSY
jgi:hypothetical protein